MDHYICIYILTTVVVVVGGLNLAYTPEPLHNELAACFYFHHSTFDSKGSRW
jgi:hypothetical protein